MKPFYLFAPIRRVDDSERTVEGYAFVQEVVEGEGGLRLTRAAMERATPDYMQWGALREMHQPQAAGTTTEIQWDEQGAYIRTRIVDDAAWKKVVERVYKGFSVGVQGLVLRGKQVTACRWIEISLVDRPKDPGAVITTFRAADLESAELNDDGPQRTTSEMTRPAAAADASQTKTNPASDFDAAAPASAVPDYDATMSTGITTSDTRQSEELRSESAPDSTSAGLEDDRAGSNNAALECRADLDLPSQSYSVRQIDSNNEVMTNRALSAEEMTSLAVSDDVSRGQDARQRHVDNAGEGGAGDRPLPETETNRLAQANAHLLRRAEMAETELATVRTQLGVATERARFLEAQPKPAKPVVRFPCALQRDFVANHAAGENASRVAELRGERAALLATASALTAQADRANAAQRLMAIDGELRMLSA